MLSPQSVAAPSGECELRLKAGMVMFAGVKLCDPCLSALRTSYLSSMALYKSTYLYLYLYKNCTSFIQLAILFRCSAETLNNAVKRHVVMHSLHRVLIQYKMLNLG